MRRRLSSGSRFESDFAYSRALINADWIFVSGTTGFEYATMRISRDVAEQTEQCFANIASVLADAGATLADVVRVRYIVTRARDFARCGPAIRRAFASTPPAATMIEAKLIDRRMKIEIEVTARVGRER